MADEYSRGERAMLLRNAAEALRLQCKHSAEARGFYDADMLFRSFAYDAAAEVYEARSATVPADQSNDGGRDDA